MATKILKPTDLQEIWAEGGNRTKPSVEKIRRGWGREVPPAEWFNWFWFSVSAMLLHNNQMGIPEWDRQTKYIGGKSYVQGSDGVIYKAVLDNSGNDPVGNSVHWRVAFASLDDDASRKGFLGYLVTAQNLSARPNYKYYYTAPARLTLPSTALRGDGISVSHSPNVPVEIRVAGSGKIRTNLGDFDTVIHDYDDEIIFIHDGHSWGVV